MKRILICHNTGKTLFLHYEQLIHTLVERGQEVICVTPADEAVPSILAAGAKHRAWDVSQHGMNPWKEFLAWRQLSKLIKDIAPDIFFAITIKPNIYGSFALLGSSIPQRFFMFSGLGYVFIGQSLKQRVLRFVVNQVIKFSFRKADGVYFQNQDDADAFVSNGVITREQAIAINGTGIDTEAFPLKQYPEDTQTAVKFLFVGRILGDKGVYEFVDAARELLTDNSNASFSLLGPLDKNPAAIQSKEIEEWERESIIRYLGVTNDVKSYLLEADVFVLPSYREGLSRATLEAMATGLPVVTTNAPGCRQTVDDGVSGYAVAVQDSSALAKAMQHFIRDRSLVAKMGVMSRQKAVDEFDVHRVVNSIINPLSL